MADTNNQYNDTFKPLAIVDLLFSENGKINFIIPSFQRGYRWERKQVNDLLDDIYAFCQNKSQSSYYLQPLVVRKNGNDWEVLDGQQRLTTMLMLLLKIVSGMNRESQKKSYEEKLYSITYKIRPNLDFNNPDPRKTIDGFYLAETKALIDRWYNKQDELGHDLSDFEKSLTATNSDKKVKFIWYVTNKSDGADGELNSINVFNRLNKGKIGLTSSELIKALFVLDLEKREIKSSKEKETDKDSQNDDTASSQLVMEWNEIERKFQDDRFWYFISNDQHNVQTRIDLLFDFLTQKKSKDDSDFSYRLFQNLFDHCQNGSDLNEFWQLFGVSSMRQAWRQIKITFDRLVAWYEDNMFYHYVGFLVNQNSSPMSVHSKLEELKVDFKKKNPKKEWTRQDSESALRSMIRDKFKIGKEDFKPNDIDQLEYTNDVTVKKLLLLFNIELCVKTDNQRFKFNDYKTEKWDIEHIDSQNESVLQKPSDRLQWLRNVVFILRIENPTIQEGKDLLSECTSIVAELERIPAEELEFSDKKYKDIYTKVNKFFSYDVSAGDTAIDAVDLTKKNKDDINNLTLLNSDINRSYKDAPFPYKRYFIIEKDKEGKHFIPIGTRNLFLKYFTSSEKSVSQLQTMRWNEADKESYLEYIHETVDAFFTNISYGEN